MKVQRARGRTPRREVEGRWTRMWRPFWAVPVAACLSALALGLLLPELDAAVSDDLPWIFEGGPDSARGVLSTIASAMISVTGLVFSITMVVLQLASSQFTPRLLGGFLGSRIVQATLGVFTASFVFALTVLRTVRGGNTGYEHFVPQISVTFAFVLVLASVGCFLAFIHHITTSIQVSHVISGLGDSTLEVAQTRFTEPDGRLGQGATWSPAPDTPRVAVWADGRHGTVAYVDVEVLARAARDADAVVTVDVELGSFVPDGACLARVWGVDELADDTRRAVSRAIGLAAERSMHQDVAFGIRQLVDIAERALSPSLNDPTTAVQVVDELHRILRLLVQRETPSPYLTDEDGTVRVVHEPQAVDQLVHLAVTEIAHFAVDQPQVPARLVRMLDDLAQVSLPRYRATIASAARIVPPPAEQEHRRRFEEDHEADTRASSGAAGGPR